MRSLLCLEVLHSLLLGIRDIPPTVTEEGHTPPTSLPSHSVCAEPIKLGWHRASEAPPKAPRTKDEEEIERKLFTSTELTKTCWGRERCHGPCCSALGTEQNLNHLPVFLE